MRQINTRHILSNKQNKFHFTIKNKSISSQNFSPYEHKNHLVKSLNHRLPIYRSQPWEQGEGILSISFIRCPSQHRLVELDDNLRTLNVGFFSQYNIRIVLPLPLHEELQFSSCITSTMNFFWIQTSGEPVSSRNLKMVFSFFL